jgi:hypothetical protein
MLFIFDKLNYIMETEILLQEWLLINVESYTGWT